MSDLRLWMQWVLANAIGELVGLGVVFVAGAFLAASSGEPQGGMAIAGLGLLVVLLATFEGAMVGLAQWLVLRGRLPAITLRSWLLATIIGAVVAWVLGMIPSTVAAFGDTAQSDAVEPPLLLLIGFAAGMGAVLGVVLAAAQWWVLRRHLQKALLWLAANALAWAVAMPLIFWLVGATIAEDRTLRSLALLVAGIGVAGAVVGAIHGVFLLRLLGRRRMAGSSV